MSSCKRSSPRGLRLCGWALALCASVATAAGDKATPPASSPHGTTAATKDKAAAKPAKPLVDINTASRKQLMTLPGIGEAEADRIIAGRPYRSKADLATTKVLPTGKYLSIRRLIVAKPPKASTSKG